MRILQVHNFYRQSGGEDRVVSSEQALLASRGHAVLQYTLHNDSLTGFSAPTLAVKTIWNRQSYLAVQRLIDRERIEIVHVHNTLPLISPSVYWAAASRNIPIVQTLHNYRLICPAATLYRGGSVCDLCVTKTLKLPSVTNRCYRGSHSASAAVAAMLAAHTLAGTYRQKVTRYIALSEFARAKFIAGGLPAAKIAVKPNFLSTDPGAGAGSGGYALFAGRLTEEKGLAPLLDAWGEVNVPEAKPSIPLKIVGDGPLQSYVRARAATIPGVEYLGPCPHSRVLDLLKDAAWLMLPSRWPEGMPLVALEAMACGTPIVAFALGSLDSLVEDGLNGVKLSPDDPAALSSFLRPSSDLLSRGALLRAETRAYFERNFTAEKNYDLLLTIYQQATSNWGSLS